MMGTVYIAISQTSIRELRIGQEHASLGGNPCIDFEISLALEFRIRMIVYKVKPPL